MACIHAHKMLHRAEDLTCEKCLNKKIKLAKLEAIKEMIDLLKVKKNLMEIKGEQHERTRRI